MIEKFLSGRVALVTGAYRNLGAATAERLAYYGASLIINDLDLAELSRDRDEVLGRLKTQRPDAIAISADLSRTTGVQHLCRAALDAFGRVDIVVNNAGPFNLDPFMNLSEEKWDLVMDVNLKAIYMITRELAPQMKRNGWGRVINMCAGSAFVRNHGVYTLAKVGVQAITESLALELGPEIAVNAVAPGQILESLPQVSQYDPSFGDRYMARAPAKRLVTRREIAQIIALLCSPDFDVMTGVTLRLDGGAEIPRF